jgi:hypothetical protein
MIEPVPFNFLGLCSGRKSVTPEKTKFVYDDTKALKFRVPKLRVHSKQLLWDAPACEMNKDPTQITE